MLKSRVKRVAGTIAVLGAVGALFFIYYVNFSAPGLPLAKRVESPKGVYTLGEFLPDPRTEAGGVACKGGHYVVGGLNWRAQTLESGYRFDPKGNSWSRLPDLPRKINHPAVVCAKGRIWVLGGFKPLGLRPRGAMIARWDPLATAFVLDEAGQKWTPAPPMPEPRGAGGAAFSEGSLWYVGGINAARQISNSLFRFDLNTRKWSQQAPMPTPRDHLRLEAVNGRLFAISGRKDDLRFNLAHVERYDISSGAWTRVADIPVARGGFASAVVEGKIYTFGGEALWSCLTSSERYDPARDLWEPMPPLPEARHGIIAGALGGRIHLVSGGRRPRVSVSAIHRILSLKPPL